MRLPSETTDRIVRLWKDGFSVDAIAHSVGVSRAVVYARLYSRGIRVKKAKKVSTEVNVRLCIDDFPQDLWFKFRDAVHPKKAKTALVRVVREYLNNLTPDTHQG
jgi:hypothetical protein